MTTQRDFARHPNTAMSNAQAREVIVKFLREIGLRVEYETLARESFLPGIEVRHGGLVVDEQALRHPCDLLHEAGHLAVISPAKRLLLNGSVDVDDAQRIEVAAIAWSYAAALHLGFGAGDLFHGDGYRGKGAALALSFSLGVYPGAALLASLGLTQAHAGGRGSGGYPSMSRWLVD